MAQAISESTAAPDAVAPPPHHRRFPLFDGLRAIAALSVLLVHVPGRPELPGLLERLVAHLNIGVTLFFLISGFLLYRPFIAQRVGGAAAPHVGDYAKRRFLRIYPAYWLALTALTVLPLLVDGVTGDWIAQYALLGALPAFPDACSAVFCGTAHTWSLTAELTFYAALPLYVLLADRLARGRPTRAWVPIELCILIGVGVASTFVNFFVLSPDAREWTGVTVLGNLFWFGLGMGLAVLSVSVDRNNAVVRAIGSRPLVPWLAAFGLYFLCCMLLPAHALIMSASTRALTVLAFGSIAILLLLPAVFGDDRGGVPRRVLANPVVAWLGLISYGIFLWHYAFALQAGGFGWNLSFVPALVVVLGLTIPAAALSYYLVERPFLRLKYRSIRRALGLRERPGTA